MSRIKSKKEHIAAISLFRTLKMQDFGLKIAKTLEIRVNIIYNIKEL